MIRRKGNGRGRVEHEEKASGELGRLCRRCARAENFEGHARSGDLRSWRCLAHRPETGIACGLRPDAGIVQLGDMRPASQLSCFHGDWTSSWSFTVKQSGSLKKSDRT